MKDIGEFSYYLCDFSVKLKFFQNEMFTKKKKRMHLFGKTRYDLERGICTRFYPPFAPLGRGFLLP